MCKCNNGAFWNKKIFVTFHGENADCTPKPDKSIADK
jgi:hypothetical protein